MSSVHHVIQGCERVIGTALYHRSLDGRCRLAVKRDASACAGVSQRHLQMVCGDPADTLEPEASGGVFLFWCFGFLLVTLRRNFDLLLFLL